MLALSFLQERSDSNPVLGFLILIIGVAFYFVPTIIAVKRNHPNINAIVLINLLLGVCGIGWVIALVWSVSAIDVTRKYR